MYKNICVAVDGSAVADAALRHAVALAAEQRADLDIVHALDFVGLPWDELTEMSEIDMLGIFRQQGENILAHAAAQARAAGVAARPLLLEGAIDKRVAELIADHAAACDLLVLGSHGHRGLSRLFLGSVAEATLRLCTAPVLIVHGAPGT
jgi:nucleotide-binding universal stress UspA family protein